MSGLFEGCISLKSVSALKKWDTSNVKSTKGMFDSCISLLDISPLSNWDVSNIESMNKMFYSCESIIDISSLESWKLCENVSIIGIFDDCISLKEYPKWFKIELIKNEKFNPESRREVIETLDEQFFRDYDLNNFDNRHKCSLSNH